MSEEERGIYTEVGETFNPNKLPREIERTIFITYGIGKYNSGRIIMDDLPPRSDEDFGGILLVEQRIKFEIPACTVDVKSRLLEILHEEKRKIIADNHMRLKIVEEKISNLLAIEFQPE